MNAPPAGTIDRWAFDYVTTDRLDAKTAPPPLPRRFADRGAPLRIDRPGRPRELSIATRASKSPGPEALRAPARRAQLFHTFWHHELQAAELMAWAILAFPDTPSAFRRGLAKIALDEVRHMKLYAAHLARLGFAIGSFPVRDWFWQRVPSARSAAEFVAVMGMGFEGGNLDHAARFAERLRNAGDAAGAAIEERVGLEEIPHVRFAASWFRRFTGDDSFEVWRAHLPPPLSPMVMRGAPLNLRDRARAALSPAFVDALARYTPS